MIKYLITLLIFTQCATIVKDPNRPYYFFSKQIDTSFYVDGKKVSETYLELPIPKIPNQKVKIKAEKSGYKSDEIELRYGYNTNVNLNLFLLILYPVGVLIDYLNGSFYSYQSERDTFDLLKDINFNENTNENSFKIFEEERKNLPYGKGFLSANKASKIITISKYENGNLVDLDNRIGFLNPGQYQIKAYFSHSIQENNYITTYEGKGHETVELEIRSNALTVLCTNFDSIKNRKTIFQILYSKPNPRLHIFSDGLLDYSGDLMCPKVDFKRISTDESISK